MVEVFDLHYLKLTWLEVCMWKAKRNRKTKASLADSKLEKKTSFVRGKKSFIKSLLCVKVKDSERI